MASAYPAALDVLANPSGGDSMVTVDHAAQHANANDAIEAIQSTFGVNPQGGSATVAARLAAIADSVDAVRQEVVSGTECTISSTTTANVTLVFTSATAVTVTIANSLANGRAVNWIQKGAGQLTFVAGSGATLNNRQSHTKSAGQYAGGSIICHENAGAAAKVVLVGDTAA